MTRSSTTCAATWRSLLAGAQRFNFENCLAARLSPTKRPQSRLPTLVGEEPARVPSRTGQGTRPREAATNGAMPTGSAALQPAKGILPRWARAFRNLTLAMTAYHAGSSGRRAPDSGTGLSALPPVEGVFAITTTRSDGGAYVTTPHKSGDSEFPQAHQRAQNVQPSLEKRASAARGPAAGGRECGPTLRHTR